jgi:hypothetical protein
MTPISISMMSTKKLASEDVANLRGKKEVNVKRTRRKEIRRKG